MTVGLQISARTLYVNSILTKLVIWDTAGQERFATIRPKYYQGADCAIVGFDMGRTSTLEHVVSRFDIQKIAGAHNFPVILTSAKTGLNVDRAFELLVRLIHGTDPINEDPLRL